MAHLKGKKCVQEKRVINEDLETRTLENKIRQSPEERSKVYGKRKGHCWREIKISCPDFMHLKGL